VYLSVNYIFLCYVTCYVQIKHAYVLEPYRLNWSFELLPYAGLRNRFGGFMVLDLLFAGDNINMRQLHGMFC
jgi:hypothetical protein